MSYGERCDPNEAHCDNLKSLYCDEKFKQCKCQNGHFFHNNTCSNRFFF